MFWLFYCRLCLFWNRQHYLLVFKTSPAWGEAGDMPSIQTERIWKNLPKFSKEWNFPARAIQKRISSLCAWFRGEWVGWLTVLIILKCYRKTIQRHIPGGQVCHSRTTASVFFFPLLYRRFFLSKNNRSLETIEQEGEWKRRKEQPRTLSGGHLKW